MAKLTNRQRLFIEAYLETWNATEAARRVGYAHPDVQGPRMLVNVGVRAAIEARMAERAMPANEVIERLTAQARLAPAEFFTYEIGDDGTVTMTGVNWAYLKEHSHLVKKISYTRDGRPVLEFHDAQAALELLAKNHGLLLERRELSGAGGKPVPVIGIEIVKPESVEDGGDA